MSTVVDRTPDGAGEPPQRKDAARNRERLLVAAAELFASQGLRAGVEDVARVAGVGMGTLYRHFPTKDALIDALVRDLLLHVRQDAQDALKDSGGAGLERFLYAVGEQQSERLGCLPRLWTAPQHRELMVEIRALTEKLLADAQRHGRVRADLVPADVFAIMWSLRGLIEMTHNATPDAWRRHLELVFVGLRPSDAPMRNEPLDGDAVKRLFDSLTV